MADQLTNNGTTGWDLRGYLSGLLADNRRRGFVPAAIAASVVWLGALAAYAAGFLSRAASAGDGAIGLLPTMDLVFFVFAVTGPLAMLWIVVLALNRADQLAEGLVAQGDSALALAATFGNLADSVDDLNAVTQRRLDGLPARVDKTMMDTTALIDQRVAERMDRIGSLLENRAAALDSRLRSEIAQLAEVVQVEREALAVLRDTLGRQITDGMTATQKQLDEDVAALAVRLEQRVGTRSDQAQERFEQSVQQVHQGLTELCQRVEQELSETRANADARLAEMLSREVAGVTDGDALVRKTLETLSADVSARLGAQIDAVETTVAAPIRQIRAEVEKTSTFVAANPPASSEELGRLLADAAAEYVAPERAAMAAALTRIDQLEERAEELLSQIDRTSRLNPLMDPAPTTDTSVPREEPVSELPFGALPRAASRVALDWTAVVRYLEGAPPSGTTRQALAQAGLDLDVARVALLGHEVADCLSQERLALDDIVVEAMPATTWAAFADGVRDPEVSDLGLALQDDVAIALVRGRLRNDADFHELALRLIGAFGDLLTRAVEDLGPNPLLVELADTPPGRAVVLLGTVLRVFEAPSA